MGSPNSGPPQLPPEFFEPHGPPVSRSGQLLATNISCLIVATLFVSMRVYSQAFLLRSLWWDDYVCILSLLVSIAFSVSSMRLCQLGLGKHLWDIPFSVFSPGFLQFNLVVIAIYPILIFLVKASICLLYVRILGANKRTKYAALAIIFFVFSYSVGGFFSIIFGCTPRRKLWDVTMTGGTCVNYKAALITAGALNIVSDLLIIALPLPLVWHFLSIPRRQKLALTAVFMTGSFVCVVAVIRLKRILTSLNSFDMTWTEFDSVLWSVVEVNVGIACACMPTLKLLIRSVFPRALDSTKASTRDTRTNPTMKKSQNQNYTELDDTVRTSKSNRAGWQSQSQSVHDPWERPYALSDVSGYLQDDRKCVDANGAEIRRAEPVRVEITRAEPVQVKNGRVQTTVEEISPV